MPAGTPSAGDQFLIKPFSTSASNVSSVFSTPRSLAVASPVAGALGAANTGSLQLSSLMARSNPIATTPVTITFTGANSYTRSDEIPANTTTFTYTSGQVIEGTIPRHVAAERMVTRFAGHAKSGRHLHGGAPTRRLPQPQRR